MKTLKFALVISLFAAGTMVFGMSNENQNINQSGENQKVVRIPITKAFQNHSLLLLMYQQIDESLIANEQWSLYEAKIKYGHSYIIIYGKLAEWQKFFLMDPCPKCVSSEKDQ